MENIKLKVMKSMKEIANDSILVEDLDKQYDNIIKILQEAKENKQPINEGLFTALFAGTAAATIGPAVMRSVCECLGVDIKGPMGSLLTSRLILTAMAAKLGWRT